MEDANISIHHNSDYNLEGSNYVQNMYKVLYSTTVLSVCPQSMWNLRGPFEILIICCLFLSITDLDIMIKFMQLKLFYRFFTV
jgi:hypothetical protein